MQFGNRTDERIFTIKYRKFDVLAIAVKKFYLFSPQIAWSIQIYKKVNKNITRTKIMLKDHEQYVKEPVRASLTLLISTRRPITLIKFNGRMPSLMTTEYIEYYATGSGE